MLDNYIMWMEYLFKEICSLKAPFMGTTDISLVFRSWQRKKQLALTKKQKTVYLGFVDQILVAVIFKSKELQFMNSFDLSHT